MIISGENGSGKSTFIEAIAEQCGFNPIGGSKDHIATRNVDKGIDELAKKMRLSWMPKITNGFFMRAESALLFADMIDDMAKDFGAGMYNRYGGTSLHNRSHGEFFIL
jgi:predicted ATPase